MVAARSGDPGGLRALWEVLREGGSALWGLISQTWWSIWEIVGGWETFGLLLVVLFIVGLVASSDKGGGRGKRRS